MTSKFYPPYYHGTIIPEAMKEVTTRVPFEHTESTRFEHTGFFPLDKATMKSCKVVILSATQLLLIYLSDKRKQNGERVTVFMDIRPGQSYETDKGLIEVSPIKKLTRGSWTNYEVIVQRSPKGNTHYDNKLVFGIGPDRDKDGKPKADQAYSIKQVKALDELLGIVPKA